MLVTGENTVHVFCEGKPDSLDAMLISRMVPIGVQIVPSHGKGGIARFVEGFFHTSDVTQPKYIVFRDRDFDVEPQNDGLISLPDQEQIFLSNRTCIENYFLDGSLFHRFWKYCFNNSCSWTFGHSPGAETLESWFLESAQSLKDYQAVRWSLARLKPETGWPSMANHLAQSSHHLPELLAREDCLSIAKRLIKCYQNRISNVSLKTFHQNLERYSGFFGEDKFWQNHLYKQYFSGKDILNHVQNRHSKQCPSMRGYQRWAVKNINWRCFTDFVELYDKLKKNEIYP